MNYKTLCLVLILHRIYCLDAQNTTTADDDDDILDETQGDSILELAPDPDHLDIYDDSDTEWIKKAVLDVAYYLRSHKFNDYDRRYFNKTPAPQVSNLFGSFPNPPLKYFHWNVFSQCKVNFITCLRYLYETVVDAYLQRSVDSVYVIRSKNLPLGSIEIPEIENKCVNLRNSDDTEVEPFEGAGDRFQWRTTASYYMCLFTLQKIPHLAHFDEPCDNFSNCLQKDDQLTNHDYRTNDSIPFQCAMYSFCPDPCCTSPKIIESPSQCEDPKELGNPCSQLNNKTCSFNFTLNTSFTSIIYNQWNVTCVCQNSSFVWSSRYGMCIDYNECQHDHPCDPETEVCLNSYGHYFCFCKFGYEWSTETNKCTTSEILTRALKRYKGMDPDFNRAYVCYEFRTTILLVIFHLLIKWLKYDTVGYALVSTI